MSFEGQTAEDVVQQYDPSMVYGDVESHGETANVIERDDRATAASPDDTSAQNNAAHDTTATVTDLAETPLILTYPSESDLHGSGYGALPSDSTAKGETTPEAETFNDPVTAVAPLNVPLSMFERDVQTPDVLLTPNLDVHEPLITPPQSSTADEQIAAPSTSVETAVLSSTNGSVAPSHMAGIPKTDLEKLGDHLVISPHDGPAWQVYIDRIEQTGDTTQIDEAYGKLLEAFPDTPSAQISHISHCLAQGEFQRVEALFGKYLRPSPSVDLWKFYLIYVRRVNSNISDPNSRQTIKKAYEFAIAHIGQDKDASGVYRDYIDFLKDFEPQTTWDAQQRMDSLRIAYQKAVVVPIENVESLWSEYGQFETGLNKLTAKKFLGDLSPAYMTARTKLRDLRRLVEPLSIPAIPLPTGTAAVNILLSLPTRPTWANGLDQAHVQAWKTYIQWETENPLELEDKAILQLRITLAYRKATLRMRFYPEIWFLAYTNIMESVGKNSQTEGAALLKEGMSANPQSYILHFAFAEHSEASGQLDEAVGSFESMTATLQGRIATMEADMLLAVEQARASVPATGTEIDPELTAERDERERQVSMRKGKAIEDLTFELGIVWIMWMRFARRAQGLKPARAVFAKARKDKNCAWNVYEAAALMEYHVTKSAEISTKIFELGMKLYSAQAEYVVRYLSFLISINDETNARALFESVILTYSAEKARPLWERWAKYEYYVGDLAAVQKLEKRIKQVYPKDPPVKRFEQRYTYMGMNPIAKYDLGLGRVTYASEGPVMPVMTPLAPIHPSQSAPRSRLASPEPLRRRREPSPMPPSKRARQASPPRERRAANHRERREEPAPRPGPADEALPAPVLWFLGILPPAKDFDGPVFPIDDMLALLGQSSVPPPGPSPATGGFQRARSPIPNRGRGRRH